MAETKHTVCGLPMKRLMQLFGVIGSVMFIVGWSIAAGECINGSPGPSFLSRACMKFVLDGLSVVFVLEFVLGTTSFLNALSARIGSSGKRPLFAGTILIVLGWLILDVYQVAVNREWVSALFYWWLMASLWTVFIYFIVVACKLTAILQQEAKPPSQVMHHPAEDVPTEDLWEERANKARKMVWRVKILLSCAALALLLASWFWVGAGKMVFENSELLLTSTNEHLDASIVFCMLHGFGLLLVCWWLWQPADKRACEGRRPTKVRAIREPSEWFDASERDDRSSVAHDSPHSINHDDITGDSTSAFVALSASSSSRKLNIRPSQLAALVRGGGATVHTI